MSRNPRKDPSHPNHNSIGGALPSLRLMLENGRANGRRWRLSAGFLLQAALLALVLSLPLFHTEPLRATAPIPEGPIYIVPVRAGQPTGTTTGSGGGPTALRHQLAAAWPKIVFPTDKVLPTGDVPASDVGPAFGSGPTGPGVPSGSEIGVPWGTGPSAKPPPPARPIRLGGRLRAPHLLRRVEPDYPLLAQRAGIEGEVVLEAVLGADGRVQEVAVLRGHALLVKAAQAAVEQWVYEPTYLNDQPVPVILEIVVQFRLRR